MPRRRPGPRLRVGLLSNLMLTKGLDVFLDLARRSASEGLALDFVLAGPAFGPVEEAIIRAALAEPGISLDWRGPVHGPDRLSFFREIDIFVFPTRYRYEAQPNVVLEAICAGVHVIAPDRGCIREDLARLGGTCMARDDEANVSAWLEALRDVAANRVALTARRAASLRRVRAEILGARRHYEEFLRVFSATDPVRNAAT
nr:glycosyltransferase [Frigidibacter sp. ROC022]